MTLCKTHPSRKTNVTQVLPPLTKLFANCRRWLKRYSGALHVQYTADYTLPAAAEMRAVALSFLDGFALAGTYGPTKLVTYISSLPAGHRGIYYEGAAAAKAFGDMASQDDLLETMRLLDEVPQYSFLLYMGIGEAMAQLKISPAASNCLTNNSWSDQIWEGYGFFNGYFRWFDTLVHQKYPEGLAPELRPAYDQGLGRAIYFLTSGKPYEIRDYISTFAPERQKEMWAGLGQPAAYAGGCDEKALRKLLELSGESRIELQQGVLLGVSGRLQQNCIPDFTDTLCQLVCGTTTSSGNVLINQDINRLVDNRGKYKLLDWQNKVRSSLKLALV